MAIKNPVAQMPADMTTISGIVSLGEFVNEKMGDRVRPDVFYDKVLLDTIRLSEDQYVYFRLAESRPIGEKAGKLVLRRRTPLKAHIVPLEEGIPPKSDKYCMMKYEIDAKQYGRYMEFTDKVSFAKVDPVISEYTQEYGIVATETLDLLARQALLDNSSKFYAGGISNLKDLVGAGAATNMKPTMTDLRLITLSMKRHLIKPRANGRYQVIGSPEFFFDMIDDEYVKAYMEINNTSTTMYEHTQLVPMFDMEFYETLACPTSGLYVDTKTKKFLAIDPDTGNISSVAATENEAGYEMTELTMDYLDGSLVGPSEKAATSYIPAKDHYSPTLSSKLEEYKAQHILILGAGALIRTGLQGEDQVKMYVKPLGSAGVLDPIDQRQSIGFKINSVGFAVIDPKAVCDYICVPSTVNAITPVATA